MSCRPSEMVPSSGPLALCENLLARNAGSHGGLGETLGHNNLFWCQCSPASWILGTATGVRVDCACACACACACVCSAEVLHQRMQRESRNYKLLPRARPHLNRPAGKARKRFRQRLTSPPKTTTTTHKKTHNLVGTWWGISEVIFFTKGFVEGLIDRKNCPHLTRKVG